MSTNKTSTFLIPPTSDEPLNKVTKNRRGTNITLQLTQQKLMNYFSHIRN